MWDWLKQFDRDEPRDPADPVAVIAWFASLNASKIYRALTGFVEGEHDPDFPPDHDGSAKVALLGIDRSLEAWRALVASGRTPASRARPCIEELDWLGGKLEAVFPRARAFVRPGFDEPDEVARLEAGHVE